MRRSVKKLFSFLPSPSSQTILSSVSHQQVASSLVSPSVSMREGGDLSNATTQQSNGHTTVDTTVDETVNSEGDLQCESHLHNDRNSLPATQLRPTPKNIWLKVLEQLSESEKDAIREQISLTPDDNVNSIFESLVVAGQLHQKKCQSESWKFLLGDREINLQEIADKTVVLLKKVKIVGDIAVNVDPLHAGLPWAVIRLLLQVAISDREQMTALLFGLNRVILIISRCEIYRSMYICDLYIPQASPKLESAIISLYKLSLQFLVLAIRLYNKRKPYRILQALWTSEQINEFDQEREKLERDVEIAATNCERLCSHDKRRDLKHLLQQLKNWESLIARVDASVIAIWTRFNEVEKAKVLQWASDIPYEDNHLTAKEGRTHETGDWLFQRIEFQTWIKSEESMILWLHGIPGAGKTKLVSKVIDYFSKVTSEQALAYFYCDRSESLRRDPDNVLRCFVKQLAISASSGPMQSHLVETYKQKESKGFASEKLSFKESLDLIHEFVQTYSQTILILDALDELHEGQRQKLIYAFNSLIESTTRLKVFISSRRDEDIMNLLRMRENVGISATDNQDDINKYILEQIEQRQRNNHRFIPESLKREIINTIASKSEGMFQWAALQIDQVMSLSLESDIRKRLGQLPKDLESTYDEIFAQINDSDGSKPEIAARAFQWVMCCKAPLVAEELLLAVCQNPNIDSITKADAGLDINFVLNTCRNLLVFDEQRFVFRLSHLSVREYLELHWQESRINGMAAKVCLMFLNYYLRDSGQLEQLEEVAHSVSLFEEELPPDEPYSQVYIASAEGNRSRTVSLSETDSIDEDSIRSELSFDSFLSGEKFTSESDEEYFGLGLGLGQEYIGSESDEEYFESWSNEGNFGSGSSEGNLGSGSSEDYLELNLSEEDLRLAELKFLGKRRQNPSHGLFQYSLRMWMVHIRHHGDAEVDSRLSVLLKRFLGSINASSPTYRCWYFEFWNTQSYFWDMGRDAYVKPLSQSGDMNTRLQPANRASLAVCLFGLNNVLSEWWEDPTLDLEATNQQGESLLVLAVISSSSDVVQRLINLGANVNRQLSDKYYGSALTAAAYWGRLNILELLVEFGADINMKVASAKYNTAIEAAAFRGEIEVATQLARMADDKNVRLEFGNALVLAISSRYFANKNMIRLLIDFGADVNAQPPGGEIGSALSEAAYSGNTTTIRLLIEKGADVNAHVTGGKYGSALAAAIAPALLKSPSPVVNLLLDEGADVQMQLRHGQYGNALIAAVATQSPLSLNRPMKFDIVESLLNRGADVNTSCNSGNYDSALIAAVCVRNTRMVLFLVQRGANVNARTEGKYGNALKAAVYIKSARMIKLLLSLGADCSTLPRGSIDQYFTPKLCRRAILSASKLGYETVVKLVLDRDDSVINASYRDGRTPLSWAAQYGHRKVMELLLKQDGIDINVKDRYSRTPLLWAAKCRRIWPHIVIMGSRVRVHKASNKIDIITEEKEVDIVTEKTINILKKAEEEEESDFLT